MLSKGKLEIVLTDFRILCSTSLKLPKTSRTWRGSCCSRSRWASRCLWTSLRRSTRTCWTERARTKRRFGKDHHNEIIQICTFSPRCNSSWIDCSIIRPWSSTTTIPKTTEVQRNIAIKRWASTKASSVHWTSKMTKTKRTSRKAMWTRPSLGAVSIATTARSRCWCRIPRVGWRCNYPTVINGNASDTFQGLVRMQEVWLIGVLFKFSLIVQFSFHQRRGALVDLDSREISGSCKSSR